MPLANGEAEDDADRMHVDRECAAVSGGTGQFPVSCNNTPVVEDTKQQESSSVGPKEIEIYTVSAMQTPCRCKNQYAYYFWVLKLCTFLSSVLKKKKRVLL